MTGNILVFPTQKQEMKPLVAVSDDIQSVIQYDYRGEWGRAVSQLAKKAVNLNVVLGHEVSIIEIGAGIAIAKYLSKDFDAANALAGTLCGMLKVGIDTIKLIEIQPQHRGYVWTLDYQNLVTAATFVRLRLESIIGRPVERHLFDF